MRDWAETELATLDLGHKVRNQRCVQTLRTFGAQPNASIPEASCNAAESKAIYRLLSSEEVEASAIQAAHARATLERVSGVEEIHVLHDKSELEFTTQRAMRGLGPLDCVTSRGLKVHTALVIANGVPQGILHQETWARDEEEVGKRSTRRQRATQEKESQYWLNTVRACEEQMPAWQRAWIIGDRESDIYDLLAMPRRPGLELLVRAAQDRCVLSMEGTHLWEAAEAGRLLGTLNIHLNRTRKRSARDAALEVRVCEVEILPPQNRKGRGKLPRVEVSAVLVREVGRVPPDEERVEWLLLSTKPIRTFEEAVQCVEAYAGRWKIERYHYVLKSGCRIEELQLESSDRIERALSLYSIVAWRLLSMTYWARIEPEQPCTVMLEKEEWQTLHRMTEPKRPLPSEPPSLREAVRKIAQLGGFLGRKGDGEPGVKVLWRGLRRLSDFVLAYHQLSHPPSRG